MDSPPDEQGEERRNSARADTKRATFFSSPAGGGVRQGTVIEISASGMRIRTHNPAPKGTELEIEVRPKDTSGDEPTVYARGIVCWSKTLPDGASSMGVRLRRGRSGGGGPPRGPGLETRWLRSPRSGHGLDALDGSGVEVRFSRAAMSAAEGRRRNRWPLLLLLLVFAGGLLWSLKDEMRSLSTRSSAVAVQDSEKPPPPEATEDAAPEAPAEAAEFPYGRLDAAYEQLIAGKPATARADFQAIATDPKENPAERFAARMGEAESYAASGDRNEALATLDAALRDTEGVAEPWRDVAKDLRLEILSRQHGGAPALFARVLEYAPVQSTQSPTAEGMGLPPPPRNQGLPPPPPPKHAGIHLRVTTSRNLLSVFEGDRTLATFPVGLGRNQSTPLGDYQVVNKILEPDWFYGGRVVKADDPENPLGGSWVGLGEDGQPTPYGIHGTNEPSSIGLNLSRGCIRMRADDARKLFEWVNIGTPVKIAP